MRVSEDVTRRRCRGSLTLTLTLTLTLALPLTLPQALPLSPRAATAAEVSQLCDRAHAVHRAEARELATRLREV